MGTEIRRGAAVLAATCTAATLAISTAATAQPTINVYTDQAEYSTMPGGSVTVHLFASFDGVASGMNPAALAGFLLDITTDSDAATVSSVDIADWSNPVFTDAGFAVGGSVFAAQGLQLPDLNTDSLNLDNPIALLTLTLDVDAMWDGSTIEYAINRSMGQIVGVAAYIDATAGGEVGDFTNPSAGQTSVEVSYQGFTIVPTPGALAVGGVGLLVASRRRR